MQNSGQQQVLFHRGNYLVPRQMLQPGEATPWHTDPCHRVTVVLSDDLLSIEYRDGTEALSCKVTPDEVDWSEPSNRVHHAANTGKKVSEEVVTFFLGSPDADTQPKPDLH